MDTLKAALLGLKTTVLTFLAKPTTFKTVAIAAGAALVLGAIVF